MDARPTGIINMMCSYEIDRLLIFGFYVYGQTLSGNNYYTRGHLNSKYSTETYAKYINTDRFEIEYIIKI